MHPGEPLRNIYASHQFQGVLQIEFLDHLLAFSGVLRILVHGSEHERAHVRNLPAHEFYRCDEGLYVLNRNNTPDESHRGRDARLRSDRSETVDVDPVWNDLELMLTRTENELDLLVVAVQ